MPVKNIIKELNISLGVLILLNLLLGGLQQGAIAQNLKHTFWTNGYTNYYTGVHFGELDDSLLVSVYAKGQAQNPPGKMDFEVRTTRKSDLSTKSSYSLGSFHNGDFLLKLLEDQGKRYVFCYSQAAAETYLFQLDAANDSAIQKFVLTGHSSYKPITVGLFDGEVYVLKNIGNNSQTDTVKLQVYDLNGSLARERVYGRPATNNDTVISSSHAIGPYQHPGKADRVVFGNRYSCQVLEVEKATLRVKEHMPREPFNINYPETFVSNYALFEDRISCGGSVYMRYGPMTNSEFDYQSYYHSRTWNGDSIAKRNFGPIGTDNRSYAYNADTATGISYLADARPFNNVLLGGAEYRTTMLYRLKGQTIDSISLFGNKNHVAYYLHPDSSGDLFLLSTFTNAWTTDSSYYQITKIPSFALELVEDGEISKGIHIYPNPAMDFVSFDGIAGSVTKAEFYDQAGKKIKVVDRPQRRVDIKGLKTGIYVVILIDSKGERFSSILQKQ